MLDPPVGKADVERVLRSHRAEAAKLDGEVVTPRCVLAAQQRDQRRAVNRTELGVRQVGDRGRQVDVQGEWSSSPGTASGPTTTSGTRVSESYGVLLPGRVRDESRCPT
jgi:hypothetical protein